MSYPRQLLTEPAEPLLPPLSDDLREALRADIAEHGIIVPVEVDENGEVIDGVERVRIADELGMDDFPRVVRSGLTEQEKLERRVALNLLRRHLSLGERRALAGRLRLLGMSNRQIAGRLGVSEGTVRSDLAGAQDYAPGGRVLGKDGKSYAARKRQRSILTHSKRQQRRAESALAALADSDVSGPLDLPKAEREARYQRARARAANVPTETSTDDLRIVLADFRDLEIEAGSADMVFTDPPYEPAWLPNWIALAAFAARVLRPGGVLVTYTGKYDLPEVMRSLGEALDYWWTGAVFQGGATVYVPVRRVHTLWKPILIFANGGKPSGSLSPDVVTSAGREKAHHAWQQPLAEAEHFISRLSRPGDMVVDPCLGGGTTAVACRNIGRRFMGCDLDPVAVAAALDRLGFGDGEP